MIERAATSGLARGVRAVSGVTLLSRFGGLIRDIVLVRTFGDTAVGSAFAAAFAIPNMFRRLFGEGALSAAFIPEYTRALQDADGAVNDRGQSDLGQPDRGRSNRAPADRFATLVLGALGLVTGTITLLVELVLAALLLFTDPTEDQRLSICLIMVMLPFMPLVCMTAIKAGMLQVHGKMGASMSGPLVLNGFIIAVGGYCWYTGTLAGPTVAYLLAVATVLSGVTQLIYFARLLRPHFQWRRDSASSASAASSGDTAATRDARARAKRMLAKFLPVMVGMGTLQLNAFIDTLIAMWPIWFGPTLLGRAYPLDESSNAIMTFTQRLYQFPLGVFGIAVATAAFPMLARHANDPAKFLHTIQRGVRLSLFIGLPASIGLALVRHDAVSVLFGFGKSGFSPGGLERSAAVLLGFALGIWAYALNHLLTRVLYAKGDTRTPMNVSIAMVLLNVSLNFTLIWDWSWLGVPLNLREAGLAWSTSVCAMVQCGVLALLARRRAGSNSSWESASESAAARAGSTATFLDAPTRVGLLKTFVSSGVMALALWLLLPMLGLGVSPGLGGAREGWTQHLIALCVSVAAGGGVYLASAFVLRSHELRWLASRGE